MRVLTFTQQDEDKFIILYSALNGSEKKLDINGFRTLVKVLDKIDDCSVKGDTLDHPRIPKYRDFLPAPEGQPVIPVTVVRLEDTEFDLVKAMVAETSWTVRVARTVVALTDMLESAPKE